MADPVVITDKMFHKGQLFGSISNGGSILDLGNGKGLKFIALNDKFVTLQVLEYGIGKEVKTQNYVKTKKVVVKVEKDVTKTKNVAQGTLKVSDDVEENDLW